MFRNRNNSQKPPDELLADFKAAFPVLNPAARRNSTTAAGASSATATPLTEALDVARHQPGEHHDIKDLDPTPRANIEQWRFTPSLLDPNSFAFTTFANQLPGYYTPTPGGSNTLYHTQAGDLHTPGFSMGLGTPLSMPHSEVSFHTDQASTGPMQSFNPQAMATDGFQNPNPFAFHHHQQHPQEQPHLQPQQQQQEHQTFSPDQFNHDPTHFGSFQLHHHDETKLDEYGDVEMHEQSPIGPFSQSLELPTRREAVLPPMENFRYHLTLNAPTAMIKHPEEIPVTYLNKGQAYAISIVDTKPSQLGGATPRYRTYIRVSFEDEQQRLRPAQCWQLWKEGRGTNEAHHRGGRLQAVEFVDPNQTGSLDQSSRPRVELESTSFDCFAVTWSPVPNGPPECSVSVRFNFLSTDFSHSKGVKGIPVRLCAKTQIVSENVPGSPVTNDAEICYCKVKLFRDHGAERKLSNDVAHVKKTIDKLKQQITQVESGIKDFGKRKRSGSGSKASIASRPGKVQKHKRTWSMSSASDTGNRGSQEEDLHAKLADLQDMFTSTRPASVLFLKSDELDDPDLHPVQLTGDLPDLPKGDSTDASLWEKQSTNTSSMVSPSPSQQSLHSERGGSSAFQNPVPFPHQSSSDWQNISQTATADLHPETRHFSPLDTNLNAQKVDTGTLTGWIEALGVDCDYQPPVERVIKPVACFYIRPRVIGESPKDEYYRAVYLMQRTIKDLINVIAVKSGVEPSKVLRVLRVTKTGLTVLMDNETVAELLEGQDMIAEFHESKPQSPLKREWDSGPTDMQVDGDLSVVVNVVSEGYELRLLF